MSADGAESSAVETSLGSSPSDALLRDLARLDDAPLAPGARLGRFTLGSVLGRGGMGVVYDAVDAELGRNVAIKVLAARATERPERLQRFLREARAAAAIDHPNVARILEVGREGSLVYLVFERVDGETLRAIVRRGPLPLEAIRSIGSAIAEGLAAAHAAGIVHRDLKPDNVMIDRDGRVRVLDFGLAKALQEGLDASGPEATTLEGQLVGTPGYMSPEQGLGRSVDGRTDLFALGVVLFEMATGTRPFDGVTPMEAVVAVSRDAAPDVRASRRELPSSFAKLVAQLLQKDPARRPVSAEHVVRALGTPMERGHRGILARAALVVATVSVLGLAILVRGAREEPTSSQGEPATAGASLAGPAVPPEAPRRLEAARPTEPQPSGATAAPPPPESATPSVRLAVPRASVGSPPIGPVAAPSAAVPPAQPPPSSVPPPAPASASAPSLADPSFSERK